ncbi:MAG TPA: hypothetical protein VL120_15425 [Solirubrobacteraceae bacterium]|nr:hypothetical protein [Solirubrobacteraceae bacterium]
MEQSTAQRRLVKSPPELWAEVSNEDTLRRHLSEFGEIRITRVEHETTVAWEGDRASGTVELAPAGWGTKVVLTATPAQQGAMPAPTEPARPAAPPPVAAPPPIAAPPPAVAAPPIAAPPPVAPPPPAVAAPKRRGFFARLFRRAAAIPAPGPPMPDPSPPTPVPTPGPTPPPAPDPVPPSPEPVPPPPPSIEAATAILTEVLDDLGAAHHRPFSRD